MVQFSGCWRGRWCLCLGYLDAAAFFHARRVTQKANPSSLTLLEKILYPRFKQSHDNETTRRHQPTSLQHPTPHHPITPFSTFREDEERTEPTMSTEMKPFTSSLADPSSSNVTGQQLSSASCAASSHAANQKHFDKKENGRHGAVNPNSDFKTADFRTADLKTFCSQWMML